MIEKLQLTAQTRAEGGKGANRRLRHENKVPAIIYGIGKPSVSLVLNRNHVAKALENEAFYSQIINLDIDGEPEQVVLKDMQRHAFKPEILHMDFLRIKATEKITMHIPLHFIGEDVAPGVKQGGIISRTISEIEVRCLPADLPSHIEVNLANLELNETIHLSDLKIPGNVELLALAQGGEYDQPVASIHLARMAAVVEEEAVAAEAVPEEEKAEEAAKAE